MRFPQIAKFKPSLEIFKEKTVSELITMKTALMVAEKPQLAQSLAKILSRGNMHSRKGFNGACSVHEYNSSFRGETVKFKVS